MICVSGTFVYNDLCYLGLEQDYGRLDGGVLEQKPSERQVGLVG